jgi:hypothetical protein
MSATPPIAISFVPTPQDLDNFRGRDTILVVPLVYATDRDTLGRGILAALRHLGTIRRACATLAELNETRPATRADIARTVASIGESAGSAQHILDAAAQIIGRGVFVSLSAEPKGRVQ